MLRRTIAWKYAIAVALILLGTVFVSRQYQKARQQCNKECGQINGRVAVSVPPPYRQAEDCDECAKNAERYFPSWYRAFVWPEGVTAWAIILTLLTIAEQTRETRRAAVATENTVSLMRGSNTQWVELEPDGLLTKTEEGQPDPPTIVIIHPRWKIINNTPLPLTLKTVEVKIATEKGWESYVFDFEELIPPAKKENYRSFFAPFTLNTHETKEFLADGIELSIAIKDVFVGVSGGEEEQFFGDLYFCKPGHLEINHPIGKGPQRQYTEKDDSPSTLVREEGFRYLEPDTTDVP